MASTFSPSLRIELIGAGDQAGTWGTTTNTNLGTLIEDAISGYTSVTISSAAQALTANNGAADESRNAVIELVSAAQAFAIYAPPESKLYTVFNNTSYTGTIYNSSALGNTTAAGTGVAIPAGKTITVWSDGTDFAVQNNVFVGDLTGNVTGNVTGNLTGNVTGNVTGNAATATALQNARTIGGVSFDGTANINLPGVNTAGNQNTSGSAASVSGTTTAAIGSSALASGTADSTTFLRGDRTWQTISSTPTTDQVLSATAGASVGAVGTYAFLVSTSTGTTYGAGDTASGSALRYGGVGMNATSDAFAGSVVVSASGTPSGTWRCMGRARPYFDSNSSVQYYGYTLWLRIS